MDANEMSAAIKKMSTGQATVMLVAITLGQARRATLDDAQFLDLVTGSLDCYRFNTICEELKFWIERVPEAANLGELRDWQIMCLHEAIERLESAFLKHRNLCAVLLGEKEPGK